MTGHWETTRKSRMGAKQNQTLDEEEDQAGMQVSVCSSVCTFRIYLTDMKSNADQYTDLPVGALSPHCIFPVRNDVGSVVRDDVVVILSIWGKGLGGTGHLGL